MSVCALEAAKLDAATLPRIKQIQKSLEHTKAAAKAETDPFKKHQLADAASRLHAALDRLRVGPYGTSSDDSTS